MSTRDPAKKKATAQRYYAAHPERLTARSRARVLQKTGTSLELYEALVRAQNNVCAICKLPCHTGRHLAVDHSHTTGRIRGLLCMNCNTALGMFKDDESLLAEAIVYLRKNNI